MKAILEFDITQPDERKAHLRAIKADNMYFVLFEINSNINKKLDYWIDANPNASLSTLKDFMFQLINAEMEINHINLDELE